jgi:hypothetical protein
VSRLKRDGRLAFEGIECSERYWAEGIGGQSWGDLVGLTPIPFMDMLDSKCVGDAACGSNWAM